MINKPIYKPKGKAGEYAEYALNIYSGCTHGCDYCYSPRILRKHRDEFVNCKPRADIVESVRRQLESNGMKGKLIHLCFTCDPYPMGIDNSVTRDVIRVIKNSGNHVQILTKGKDARRDFDLLDENDWVGITLSGAETAFSAGNLEPNAAKASERIGLLTAAKSKGINTWVSYEPVIDQITVLSYIVSLRHITDKIKVGKPNNYKATTFTTWREFGREVIELCEEHGIDYYIKDSLRAEMDFS